MDDVEKFVKIVGVAYAVLIGFLLLLYFML